MKLDLPSGAWVEMRDPGSLTAGDRAAMHAAVSLPMNGSTQSDGAVSKGLLGEMTNRLPPASTLRPTG